MRTHLAVAGLGLLACIAAASAAPVNPLEDSLAEATASAREGAQSQARIDNLQSETTALSDDYRSVIRQLERVERYNENLEKLVASQAVELRRFEEQLAGVDVTRREIMPLVRDMVDDLEEIVALDMPFLTEERSRRIEGLKSLLDRSDATAAEKYRRAIEVYQREADYGHTIEAYAGSVAIDGQQREVDFLRVGRVVLAYQTPDGKQAGYWDNRQKRWQAMSASDARFVREGLRIARRQSAQKLLRLPVPAPETVR